MEVSPVSSKEPTSAKLRRALHHVAGRTPALVQLVIDSIRSIFTAAHQRTLGRPLAKRASRWLGWGLIVTGIAVAKWDEYCLALGLFLGGSFVLVLRAYLSEIIKGPESSISDWRHFNHGCHALSADNAQTGRS